jgi:hypothetical protein
MNIFLWALQVILSIKLLDVAYKHGLRRGMPTMQDAIGRLGAAAPLLLTIFAVCALLGVAGLLLPGLLSLPAILTPTSALFVAVLLLISIYFHLRSRDKPKIFVSLVLLAFALFIAYGRYALAPL